MAMALLETMIALAFVYAVLSVIASGVQEAAASLLNRRGAFLYDGVDDLLKALNADKGADEVLQQPVLKPLITRTQLTDGPTRDARYIRRHAPSYIPADLFAATVAPEIERSADAPGLDRIPAASNDSAKAAANTTEQGLTRLFDATMERVSGRYARRSRIWLLAIGFALAGAMNADTLHIAQTLYRDPARASSAADLAEAYVASHAQSLSAGTDPGAQRALVDSTLNVLRAQLAAGDTAALPLGWHASNVPWSDCGSGWCTFGAGLSAVIGWLLTAFAVSLGAPFWFDLLNKVVNVRGAGRKPGTTEANARATIEIQTGDSPPLEIVATGPPR